MGVQDVQGGGRDCGGNNDVRGVDADRNSYCCPWIVVT